jgi:hypothetical protein
MKAASKDHTNNKDSNVRNTGQREAIHTKNISGLKSAVVKLTNLQVIKPMLHYLYLAKIKHNLQYKVWASRGHVILHINFVTSAFSLMKNIMLIYIRRDKDQEI